MIDGTALILVGTLILVALGRALRRHWYEKGWHAGRAALIREQTAKRVGLAAQITALGSALTPVAKASVEIARKFEDTSRSIRRLNDLFDQDANA